MGADTNWSRSMYMSDRNFEYASMMATRPGLDMWESLGRDFGFGLTDLLAGRSSTAETVDLYSSLFQQSLDRFFGKAENE